MSNQQRIGLVAAGVVLAVVAFLLLQPGDDDDNGEPSKPATTQTATTTTPTETTTPPPETTEAKPTPEEPEIPPIEIENGKPVAGVEEFQFEKGETIVFKVKSDAKHEIHLHGYDVSHDVPAGATTTFKVKANIEGIFEVEIEDTKTQIAEITIKP